MIIRGVRIVATAGSRYAYTGSEWFVIGWKMRLVLRDVAELMDVWHPSRYYSLRVAPVLPRA